MARPEPCCGRSSALPPLNPDQGNQLKVIINSIIQSAILKKINNDGSHQREEISVQKAQHGRPCIHVC